LVLILILTKKIDKMKFPFFKLSFLALIIVVLTTFSCRPEEIIGDVPVGTISANIGTDSFKSIGGSAIIYADSLGAGEIFSLLGPDLQFNSLSINFIAAALDITNTSYTQSGNAEDCEPTGNSTCIQLAYSKPLASKAWSNVGSDSELKVTFSAVDYQGGGSVKGTFKGKIYNPDTQESLDVTNGVFNLKITE